MPTKTKKGKSKPGKARKATNKMRRTSKRSAKRRPGTARRTTTRRRPAKGASFPTTTGPSASIGKATSPPPILAPQGSPNQKATDKSAISQDSGEGAERVTIL